MRDIARLGLLVCCVCSAVIEVRAAEPAVQFVQRPGVLQIKLGDVAVADYVYQDKAVSRPYFAAVKTPSGIQVTRLHPPRPGVDAEDHLGLHTGIWLSFGDLSGHDYWRLKARTEHAGFVAEPQGSAGQGTFTVRNRYLATTGQETIAEEVCHYRIQTVPGGYLLDMQSEFRSERQELVFGDQEELGLGVRLATELAVDKKLGGRILDDQGRRNGSQIWGKTVHWCDYSGPLSEKWVGMTVCAGPDNFRPCWAHARDYGFLALNPFGRNAFTKGEPSRVVVKPGVVFKLRYGVIVHESATEADYDPATAYRAFAKGTPQP